MGAMLDMKPIAILLLSACFVAPCSFADDVHEHAVIQPEQLGTVHFPVSCAANVQEPFERGVALLHSFWYEEAEKQFEHIAVTDPRCAMAHWGIAMSLWHQLWDAPDAQTITKGQAEVQKGDSLRPPSARERQYLAAISAFYGGKNRTKQSRAEAYTVRMAALYKQFPGDKEAGAFYGLALRASEPEDAQNLEHRKQAASVLEPIFAAEPQHPGVAHYLIHAYDSPQMAQQGLSAAKRYSQIAPASPHAVHMPSHIYARLGLWQEDIDANLKSVTITRETAARGMGGEAHQFHALDFIMYAYLQSGRDADALKLIEEVKSMPSMKPMYGMDIDPHLSAQARYPAFYDIELRHWNDAEALSPIPGAKSANARIYWARAIGAARSGNLKQAQSDLDQLAAFHKDAVALKDTFVVETVEREQVEAQAWMDHASGRDGEAAEKLKKLAETEEAEAFRDEVGGIPAREMLADLLLDINRPEQALVEYQADLKFNPNRFNGLYGAAQAAQRADKQEEANAYYLTLVKVCGDSDRPEFQRAKSLIAGN